jgi:peptidyl-prolyl cis-trans isomerase D
MLSYLRENTGNWIIKIFLGIIVIVFVFLGVGSMSSNKNKNIATIDDEPITFNEFQDAYKMVVEQMRTRFGDNLNDDLLKALNVKQQAINSLIDRKLVEKEAEKLNILVSDKELQDALLSIKAFQIDGAFNLEQYKKVLGFNSTNPEIFEVSQRSAIKEKKVRDLVLSGITVSDMEARDWYIFQNTKVAVDFIKVDSNTFTDVIPNDVQIKKQYEDNKDMYKSQPSRKAVYLKFSPEDHKGELVVTDDHVKDFYEQNLDQFKVPEKVEARHILIKVDENADEAVVETARKQALEIYEKAAKGQDFSELAKELSQGPSRDNGGYVGIFDKASMVKPFGDKAFSMKPGEISKPIKTMFGWHIIKVMAKFEATVETLAQATEKIRTDLEVQEFQNMAYYQAGEAFDSVIDGDDLEQVALITKRKVMTTDYFSGNGEGLDLEDSAGFAQAAFSLVNDEISDVKQLGNNFYLIKVIEKTEPEVLTLETVKESIVLTLTAKFQKEAARKAAQTLAEKAKTAGSIEQLARENDKILATTNLFTRNESIEPIGSAPELVKAAFTLGLENPVHPAVLETAKGLYIIGFKDRQVPKDEIVDENLQKMKQEIARRKQGQYYASWIEELKTKTKIEINSKYLN